LVKERKIHKPEQQEVWQEVMVPPDPVGVLRGLQNAGYRTEGAVADLLDNSVSAGSSHIFVRLDEDGGRALRIEDDGQGMSAGQLIEAMRISSQSLNPRSAYDLGHYGIGLKSAALYLSASGRMEVDSRNSAGEGGRTGWSVEEVSENGWHLRVGPSLRTVAGTTVTIHDPRIPEGEEGSAVLSSIARHLGLTFAVALGKGLEISVQGRAVQPYDPCSAETEGVRRLGPWSLPERQGQVTLLVLPVACREFETPAERQTYAGVHLRCSGRAITSGGWMRLLAVRNRPEAANRLRLCIDIPRSELEAWRIGVAKADATVPDTLLPRLREIVQEGLERAGRQRTLRPDAGRERQPVEKESTPWLSDGRLDRAHPYVHAALEQPTREHVERLLRTLEKMT